MATQQFTNGPISANDLMSKLAQAKKVMNKVDGGNYKKGNINESSLLSDPEDYTNTQTIQTPPTRPVSGPVNVDKIQNSKLPDAIKQAMINHPIEQMPSISLNETLDMDFIKGAKRLMDQENGIPVKKTQQRRQQVNESYSEPNNFDMSAMAILIENTVRKVLDEKLNQILSAQQTQSINENLVLKVGDSIFKGKITGVNKSK
jgi:hypothetical protein